MYLWNSRSKMHVRNKWKHTESQGNWGSSFFRLSSSLSTPSLSPSLPRLSPSHSLFCTAPLTWNSFLSLILYTCFILSSCQPLFYCFFVCMAKYGFWIYCALVRLPEEREEIFFLVSWKRKNQKMNQWFFYPLSQSFYTKRLSLQIFPILWLVCKVPYIILVLF